MEPEYALSEKKFILNPKQEKIIQRLNRLVGPGSASFYEDACYLMAQEPHLPSTTHIVSHLLREIESALRDVLEPFLNRSTFANTNGDEEHKEEILAILQALEIPQDNPIAIAWLGITGKTTTSLNKRAHRNALGLPRTLDMKFIEFWFNMEAVLDSVLNQFEAKYLTILNQLETLRGKKQPGYSDARFLKENIPNNMAAFSYFFTDLINPAWLRPLQHEGLFSSPPEPIENKKEGTISFPPWPQSRYLLAMASLEPELVSEIILTIETKNASILADLLDAICQFPPYLAAKHVEKVSQWEINAPFLLGKKIGSLVSHLSQGKEIKGASLLTKEFLRLRPSKKMSDVKETKEVSFFSEEPHPIVDNWEYSEFLKNNFPDFYKVAPREALSTVINTLDSALSLYQPEKNKGYLDYSEIWRPAIEDHAQNQGYQDPKYELVTAIRISTEYCLTQNIKWLEDILSEFEEKKWTIFIRFALYFLRKYSAQNFKLAESYILKKSLFSNSHIHHEYVCLVRELFSKLDDGKQKKILSWIQAGPKIQPDEENPKEIKEWWQLRWLTILKGQLPPEWEKTRQSLLFGKNEPENPDFLFWSGEVMSGPRSPITVEEFMVMSVEEIVVYLHEWKLPSGFSMDSPEGLSRTLSKAISEDPVRFANDAEKFIGSDPTYVRGVFSGLQKALESDLPFYWHPVIKLMNWVVSQERAISGREESKAWDQDPDWGWTRTVIAGLLEKGFNSQKNQIPYSEELQVWKVLQPLTDDPNPTDSEDSETGMGPAMQSINTTRGTAFHSLVAFALWKKRNILKMKIKKEDEISLNKDMPEVLIVLEKHLDPIYDSSPSIRAVYGWRFPNLAYIDHKWALSHKDRIFSKKSDERQYWNAAWSSCVGYNNANKNMLQDLYAEYLFSLSSLSTLTMKIDMGNNPYERLVEHLMLYYAWGLVSIDSELMKHFWVNSSPNLRGYALRFIGKFGKNISVEVIYRLKVLWETRIKFIENSQNIEPFTDEVKAFGWIFCSHVFDNDWVVCQLEKALSLSSEIDNSHDVVAKLATLPNKFLMQTMQLIEKLVEGDKKRWLFSIWRENIRIILKKAIKSKSIEIKKKANILINRFTSLGYFDLKDLHA